MDLTAMTLSVLVKQINRSNSSRDGFYTIHQRLSIGMTPVQPDNSDPHHTHLTLAYFALSMIKIDTLLSQQDSSWFTQFSVLHTV